MNFPGYKLVRADYPGNVKGGGVCIYFKESLSIRFLGVPSNLDECLLCELSYKNKKYFIATLYRSPSQSREEFEKFLSNFEVLIKAISNQKDAISMIMGDLNARSSNWRKYDISNNEGVQIDSVTSTHGLEQLISEPTHILSDSSSCIDLIFTNQPNLVVDSGTHPSLHPNCHHQIIHCKINLQVEYPPHYQRHVWNYAKANKDAILSALQNVDWHRFFAKKTVHQQVNLLNDIILNVFTNFVHNKVITCDDRDPPWINDKIKNKIKWKNSMHKNYKRNGKKTEDYELLVKAVSGGSQLTEKSKGEYYYRLGKRLNHPSTSAKSYWTILKTFYNKKGFLLSSLLVNNSFVTDFKEKANLFNEFFCKQCTPVADDSTLPTLLETPNETLSSIEIIASDIGKINKALKANKVHVHDEISIRMLKLCESGITEPLYLIFKNCLNSNTFPDVWKKANVIPVHKKGDKQVLKNYRPVSLLPICGKIFEKL